MNYTEALSFIHSVSNFFCKPGLDRITALCEYLGNPQDSLKFVHIAGTNGKGSLSAFLSNILQSAGYTVGLYTSPYILRFNERIKVNGEDIPDSILAEICEKVKAFCDITDDKPTEFEIITAIAFEYFKRKGCDIVVLECGLGGRLDATNVIKSTLLSVITEIDLDHQGFLGDTVEKIAGEKAGIIKPDIPCLWCGSNKEAKSVILKEAQNKGSDIYLPDNEINIKKADLLGTVFSYKNYNDIEISLLGSYQPYNARNAISAAEILNLNGFSISEEAIYSGLKATKWPARFELLNIKPIIIFDGAHNPNGIAAAKKSILQYFTNTKVNILTGVMADKDYNYTPLALKGITHRVYCVKPNNPRALDADALAEVFNNEGISAEGFKNIKDALTAAIENSVKNNIPLICLGSLYLYSDIFSLL